MTLLFLQSGHACRGIVLQVALEQLQIPQEHTSSGLGSPAKDCTCRKIEPVEGFYLSKQQCSTAHCRASTNQPNFRRQAAQRYHAQTGASYCGPVSSAKCLACVKGGQINHHACAAEFRMNDITVLLSDLP